MTPERHPVQSSKERVKEIYGFKCAACGKERPTIHHIVFKSDTLYGIVPPDYPLHQKANYCPLCNECQRKLHDKVTKLEKPYRL